MTVGQDTLTIIREGAGVCQGQQHIQHRHSIRQFIEAMDVLTDSAEQLTYHPWKETNSVLKISVRKAESCVVNLLEESNNLSVLYCCMRGPHSVVRHQGYNCASAYIPWQNS